MLDYGNPIFREENRLTIQDISCTEGWLFSVTLSPECAVEVTGGAAYSVGSQWVNVAISGDTRECLPGGSADVLVNGLPPPVFVNDGEGISVSINSECPCFSEGPICGVSTPFLSKKQILKRQILSRFRKLS